MEREILGVSSEKEETKDTAAKESGVNAGIGELSYRSLARASLDVSAS